jgi:chromosome segregation ATPase
MVTSRAGELSELSQVIGELRNAAAAQMSTNTHILDELKKIGERLSGLGEVSATFVEYRKANHERWARVHEQINAVDERVDKIEEKLNRIESTIADWKGQKKTSAWLMGTAITLVASIVATFGGAFLKTLAANT